MTQVASVTEQLRGIGVDADEVMEHLRGMVADCRTEFFNRKYDYFEFMEGHGNGIKRCERGTDEWQRYNAIWTGDEIAEDDSFEEDILVHDILHDGPGPYWHHHLTGERRATHEYPGWFFPTFRHQLIDDAIEVIEASIAEATGDEDYEWCAGDIHNMADDAIDALLF